MVTISFPWLELFTVVDECGRTVVSYKTGVFVGLENVKCPATFRCRRMSGVTLKNCGRSTMQGDKLRWSFYRKIDSWFLWLLIEIPTNSNRFQPCVGNRLRLPSWSFKYYSVPFVFGCRFVKWLSLTSSWEQEVADRTNPPSRGDTEQDLCQTCGTVDGSDPAPVEVGSLSHYLQGFCFPSACLGFLNHQQYITSFFWSMGCWLVFDIGCSCLFC